MSAPNITLVLMTVLWVILLSDHACQQDIRTMEYPAQDSDGDHTNTTELVIDGKCMAGKLN